MGHGLRVGVLRGRIGHGLGVSVLRGRMGHGLGVGVLRGRMGLWGAYGIHCWFVVSWCYPWTAQTDSDGEEVRLEGVELI